jgi:superfamily I DNA/RNA helicase
VEYIRSLLKSGEKLTAKPRVRLQTIHTAKGGEAEHVVLLLEVTRQTSLGQEKRPDDELRTWYVGATRAKERLTMVEPSCRDRSSYRCAWL